jgi:hypothetical protein
VKAKTVGVSPKAFAAVVTAALTYVLGQSVLALPAWAVVLGQVVLVSIAAYAAGPGTVTRDESGESRFASERGSVEPLSLLIYVLVAIILIVLIFALLDRLE